MVKCIFVCINQYGFYFCLFWAQKYLPYWLQFQVTLYTLKVKLYYNLVTVFIHISSVQYLSQTYLKLGNIFWFLKGVTYLALDLNEPKHNNQKSQKSHENESLTRRTQKNFFLTHIRSIQISHSVLFLFLFLVFHLYVCLSSFSNWYRVDVWKIPSCSINLHFLY